MLDVVTIGSATRDVFMRCEHIKPIRVKQFVGGKGACFPLGAKLDLDELYFLVGGGAVNTAVTFANHRLKVAPVAAIGRDTRGEQIVKMLREKNISTNFLYFDPHEVTAYSVIISLAQGARTVFRYQGAVWHLHEYSIPWNSLQARWFYINHLGDESAGLFQKCIAFAKKKRIHIACNPGSTQFERRKEVIPLLKHLDVLLVNQEEASYLTNIPYEKTKEIFHRLDDLVHGIVIMTKGPKGVEVSDGKTIWSSGVLPLRKIVDRTGAGDAFGSGFVASLIKKPNDIERAIQFASSNATGVLTEWGAINGLLKKRRFSY